MPSISMFAISSLRLLKCLRSKPSERLKVNICTWTGPQLYREATLCHFVVLPIWLGKTISMWYPCLHRPENTLCLNRQKLVSPENCIFCPCYRGLEVGPILGPQSSPLDKHSSSFHSPGFPDIVSVLLQGWSSMWKRWGRGWVFHSWSYSGAR